MELIEELQAEREIHTLLGRYCQLADDEAAQNWSELFAEDGRLCIGKNIVTGQTDLRAWLEKISVSFGKTRHLKLNAVISFESDRQAQGSVDMVIMTLVDGKWVIGKTPRYRDVYVKVAGAWRFAERAVELR